VSVSTLLNRTLTVTRRILVDDGAGGSTQEWVEVGTVRAQVNQPTDLDQIRGAIAGNTNTYDVHMLPDSDVRPGDRLTGGGQLFEVIATKSPSRRVYLKAICELRQGEGSTNG
jgi:SPP1 family predicted phage head-tail adaptor